MYFTLECGGLQINQIRDMGSSTGFSDVSKSSSMLYFEITFVEECLQAKLIWEREYTNDKAASCRLLDDAIICGNVQKKLQVALNLAVMDFHQ